MESLSIGLDRMRLGAVAVLSMALAGPALAGGTTITVPTDQPTIQDAINVALNGDTIIVIPDIYNEVIDFLGKDITVFGPAGAADTVIDGTGLGDSVVTFNTSESPNAVLDGFSIVNGTGKPIVAAGVDSFGGGIYVGAASPTIQNCEIAGNSATGGGGILVLGGNPVIQGCIMSGNTATGDGGGAWTQGGQPEFINSAFSANGANRGAGAFVDTGTPQFHNCSFNGNTATADGGGLFHGATASANVDNSIVWGNFPGDIFVDSVQEAPGGLSVSYTNVGSSIFPGTGNISADPKFEGAPANLRLLDHSPCIDAGSNSAVPVGVTNDLQGSPRFYDDVNVVDTGEGTPPITDMGAFERQTDSPPFVVNVPADASTIQAAIDLVNDPGDVIVDPGTYNEAIDFGGKAVTLISSSGDPSDTRIDGTGLSSITLVTCNSGEGSSTVIDGFTIQNGSGVLGGGMICDGASPNITNCVFLSNDALAGGGIININGANPQIVNCKFLGNTVIGNGGAISNGASSNPEITNCLFSGNAANNGGAISNTTISSPSLYNCTIVANTATTGGGGVYSSEVGKGAVGASSPNIFNSLIGGNSPNQVEDINAFSSLFFCNVEGGWFGGGSDNIDEDPLFVDLDGPDDTPGTEDDDLRLTPTSPSINRGDRNLLPFDSTDINDDDDTDEVLPLDLDGNDRVIGMGLDQGSYESEFAVGDNDGRATGDSFGSAVARIGDVDGDMIDDYAIGAPNRNNDKGKVFVYSGADDDQIWAKNGVSDGDLFGWSVAGMDDVDGDMIPDLVVGAPGSDINGVDSGRVFVLSGVDGDRLYAKPGKVAGDQLGFAVASGDMDGDGDADALAGAPFNDDRDTDAGQVLVYDGATGVQIRRLLGVPALERFGWSITVTDDLDGDGEQDFVVGAPWNDDNGVEAGRISAFSGNDNFTRLYNRRGDTSGDRFGFSVGALSDIDGDSRGDFAVGAAFANSEAGRVFAMSGAGGNRLFNKSGQAGSRFGTSVASAGDVNCDAIDDILVGAELHDAGSDVDAGRLRVLSGMNGATLDSIAGDDVSGLLGHSVATLGDIDDDDRLEFLVGAPGAGDTGQGQAYVVDSSHTCVLMFQLHVPPLVIREWTVNEIAGRVIEEPEEDRDDLAGDGR